MGNIRLQPLDALFGAADTARETMIPLDKLREFRGHPFHVDDDEEMDMLVQSIRQNGVLMPVIVRENPREHGTYEILAGHRRAHASRLAGLASVPAQIKHMSDEDVTILMVDSNMHRENIRPSEKAWAYRMRQEARKSRGRRTDLTEGGRQNTAAQSGQQGADSTRTVFRYIRLTYLIPEILKLVDDGQVPFMTGVTLSYMQNRHQRTVFEYYSESSKLPGTEQAELLKKLSSAPDTTEADILHMLESMFEGREEQPATKPQKVVLKRAELTELFEEDASEDYMKDIIVRLLQKWRDGTVSI